MERFELTVDLENAAFEDAPMTELSRVLRLVARKVAAGDYRDGNNAIMDANGNSVGAFHFEE